VFDYCFRFGARKIKLNLITSPKKKREKNGEKERKEKEATRKTTIEFYTVHQSYFNLSFDFPAFL